MYIILAPTITRSDNSTHLHSTLTNHRYTTDLANDDWVDRMKFVEHEEASRRETTTVIKVSIFGTKLSNIIYKYNE